MKVKASGVLTVVGLGVLACAFSYFLTAGIIALILLCFDAMELFTWVRVLGVWFLIIAIRFFFKKKS